MDRGLVQAFLMGFGCATMLYFVISGLAWIRMTHGMDQEDSLALVEQTNGKTLSEIMGEGHMRIGTMAALPKEMADTGPDSTLTATEMELLLRKLPGFPVAMASNAAKKTYLH